ncbi:MAG TPA: glycosyltransferase family 2 protein [Allocoleopsis sp.]
MDRQRVSVAMCTYNGERYLQEQLDSIATQTHLPDELIVCDDRSSDRTIEILQFFKSKVSFPVHLYINPDNLGTIKNFEKAISLCTGDIIVLSDQDDIWKPHKLETILQAFAKNAQAGYVFSNADLIDDNSRSLGLKLWESLGFQDSVLEAYNRQNEQVSILLKRNLVWGATMAFKASLKDAIMPISLFVYMHDAWIALVSSCTGFYGIALSEPLIDYRQHSTQQVGGRNTLFQKFKRASNPKDTDFLKIQIQGLSDVKNRLSASQNALNKDISNELDLIHQKAKHFSKRVDIRSSSNLLLKLKDIVSEFLTGNYHRFSNSWQSVIKDLLLQSQTELTDE